MPVFYKIETEEFKLGIWQLQESMELLSQLFKQKAPSQEIKKVENFSYTHRKSEWMAVRLLLYELLGDVVEVNYDQNGKPYLEDRKYKISISHTKGVVAAIVTQVNSGIDVEYVNERVLKIESKFMSSSELMEVNTDQKAKKLLLYWSAKETLYKLYGVKGLDFKKNIGIQPFELKENGEIGGRIEINNKKAAYRLNYFFFNIERLKTEYVLVYCFN
ncbi:MAG: 4'-phosphopantetheinyl transferase superfamily protein [Bacteroidales bacterium]